MLPPPGPQIDLNEVAQLIGHKEITLWMLAKRMQGLIAEVERLTAALAAATTKESDATDDRETVKPGDSPGAAEGV